jgi:hypothetical protein
LHGIFQAYEMSEQEKDVKESLQSIQKIKEKEKGTRRI